MSQRESGLHETYAAHPAMFRARPILFVVSVLLIPAFGIGVLVLLLWYVRTRMTRLVLTPTDILFEKGILSKDRIGMGLHHIRTIRVRQSLWDRVFRVGAIEVYTAGDAPEFTVADMPNPQEIRDAIGRAQRRAEEARGPAPPRGPVEPRL